MFLKNMSPTNVSVRKKFNFWETTLVDSLSARLLIEIFIRLFMTSVIIFIS